MAEVVVTTLEARISFMEYGISILCGFGKHNGLVHVPFSRRGAEDWAVIAVVLPFALLLYYVVIDHGQSYILVCKGRGMGGNASWRNPKGGDCSA